jgi:hypothetical protein
MSNGCSFSLTQFYVMLQDVPAPCDGFRAADVTFRGGVTMFNSDRSLKMVAWSQDGDGTALNASINAANSAGSTTLVIPGNRIAQISSGTHTIILKATNYLNVTEQAAVTFTKRASGATPVVSVLGGPTQTFRIAQGVAISSQLVAASVCASKTVSTVYRASLALAVMA